MKNKNMPSWLNSKQRFLKTAAAMSGGVTLSKDTKDWPNEIIDHIHDKFPFLKKYSIVLNIDKKDKDTMSAMMYGVVVLGEGKKISIVISVSNGKLLPVFVFVYNGEYYPIIEEVIEDIENETLDLGEAHDIDNDFEKKKTPWSAMLDFLQNSVFDKRANIIKRFEKEQDLNKLDSLMKNEKIASLMHALIKEKQTVHVKTASHRNGLYKEIVDGKITQVKNVMLDTHISSNRVKTAEINRAIASDKDAIIHYTDATLDKVGYIIKGKKTVPLIQNKNFKIFVNSKIVDVKCINKKYETALVYSPENGFFVINHDGAKYELSEKDIKAPEPVLANENNIGKKIIIVNDSAFYNNKSRVINTIVKDGDETIYVTDDETYIYAPYFKVSYRDGFRYINSPLKVYVLNESVNATLPVEKVASEPGIHIHLEKKETEGGTGSKDESYSLTTEASGVDNSSMVFPKVKETQGEEELSQSITGDKVDIEHRLAQEGLTSGSIKQLVDEADKEGTAVMFVKEKKLVKDEPTEEAIKTAASIQKTVSQYLSFDKLSSFINNDNVSDVFSLHFLSKENISQFMDEVPKIESVIDHLSRYYVLRTVGLSSDSDMIDTKSLEKLLTGLYRVLRDLKKYRAISVN